MEDFKRCEEKAPCSGAKRLEKKTTKTQTHIFEVKEDKHRDNKEVIGADNLGKENVLLLYLSLVFFLLSQLVFQETKQQGWLWESSRPWLLCFLKNNQFLFNAR